MSSNRRYDAIISDIDGCLGPESSGPLNALALAQLATHNQRAASHGDLPAITLCSGRPLPYVEAMCRMISNMSLPAVCEMGVWLFDSGKHRYEMDPSISADHRRAIREAIAWIEETLVPLGVVVQPGKSASISLWHHDTATLMDLKPRLTAHFDSNRWPLRVSSTVAWVNCDLAHVSKASGLRRLCDSTGLERSRLVGIGDTMGDMAIREHVAFFGCPANAQPQLKAHADYVSPHDDILGVLDIIEQVTKT